MAKIIFLDVDGVLNSKAAMERQMKGLCPGWGTLAPEGTAKGLYGIDPVHVAVLEEVVQKTGAKVVISSAWRKFHTVEEITTFLRNAGFTGEVIGKTGPGRWGYQPRGFQIQEWLDDNRYNDCDCKLVEQHACTKCGGNGKYEFVEKFVIIDDSGDMVHLMHRLFQTESDIGLLPEHADQIVGMLS